MRTFVFTKIQNLLTLVLLFSQKVRSLNTNLCKKPPNCFKLTCQPENIEKEENKIDLKTYIFGKEGEFKNDLRRNNVDPLRFVTFTSLSVFIALGANFLGITESILSASPPIVVSATKSIGLDQVYAVNGFKRYVSEENKYELLYPKNWLFDQAISLSKIKYNEIPQVLRDKVKPKQSMLPDCAFGPAGEKTGKLNLSVIKNKVLPGFSLDKTLGTPQVAAEFLLNTAIAPESSGKTAALLNAYEDRREGLPAYVFEYTIQKGPSFYQHAVSVIMYRDNELFTLTAVAPENMWEKEYKEIFSTVSKSFMLK